MTQQHRHGLLEQDVLAGPCDREVEAVIVGDIAQVISRSSSRSNSPRAASMALMCGLAQRLAASPAVSHSNAVRNSKQRTKAGMPTIGGSLIDRFFFWPTTKVPEP